MYTWKAFYSDGTTVQEIDDDGKETMPGSINHELVKEIHIIPLERNLPTHKVKLISPEQRLIAFARRVVAVGDSSKNYTIWCVGWQRTDGGKNTKSILRVYPDGSVVMDSGGS